jgi:hypothetical protein
MFAELADAPPAIAAGPVWNQFEDAIDGFAFLHRALLHGSQ